MSDYSETLSKIADFAKMFNAEERKAERLDDLYASLKEAHKILPQLRFGQFLFNVLGDCDLFYIEDGELVKLCHDYAEREKIAWAIRNQIASGQMEGLVYTDEDYGLINRVVNGEITTDEAIKRIKEDYHERD